MKQILAAFIAALCVCELSAAGGKIADKAPEIDKTDRVTPVPDLSAGKVIATVDFHHEYEIKKGEKNKSGERVDRIYDHITASSGEKWTQIADEAPSKYGVNLGEDPIIRTQIKFIVRGGERWIESKQYSKKQGLSLKTDRCFWHDALSADGLKFFDTGAVVSLYHGTDGFKGGLFSDNLSSSYEAGETLRQRIFISTRSNLRVATYEDYVGGRLDGSSLQVDSDYWLFERYRANGALKELIDQRDTIKKGISSGVRVTKNYDENGRLVSQKSYDPKTKTTTTRKFDKNGKVIDVKTE